MADVLAAFVGGGVRVRGSVLAVRALASAATTSRHALAVFQESGGDLGVVVGVGGGGGVVGGVRGVDLGVLVVRSAPLLGEGERWFLELLGCVVVPPGLVVL